jgi:hypothetical protein
MICVQVRNNNTSQMPNSLLTQVVYHDMRINTVDDNGLLSHLTSNYDSVSLTDIKEGNVDGMP